MNLGDIHVSIGADTSQFERGMSAVSARLQEVGNRLQSVGQSLTRALTVPLGILGGVALKTAATMDSLDRGLTAVMGSTEAAKTEMEKLREVAKLPGLGLEEAARGSTNLQAVGYSAEQSRKILMNFGNALATVGKGKAELDGVILALSQIQSKGKVSAEEINQIAERVPQIRKVMQEAFGTADTEVLQKMGLSSTEFVNRITEEFGKLPKVTGGMQNAFENMSDTVKISLATLGKSIFDTFNLGEKIERFSKFVENLTTTFQALSPETQKIILSVAGIAAAIGPLLIAFGAISKVVAVVQVALAGLSAPILAIGAVVAGVAYLIISNWGKIEAYFQGEGKQMVEDFGRVWDGLKEVVTGAMGLVSAIVSVGLQRIAEFWASHGEAITTIVRNVWKFVTDTIGTALSQIGQVFSLFGNVLTGNWEKAWSNVQTIAYNAVNYIIRQVNSLFDAIGLAQYKIGELNQKAPRALHSSDFPKETKPTTQAIPQPTRTPLPSLPSPTRRPRATGSGGKSTAEQINDVSNALNNALETIARKRGALDINLFPRADELQAKISAVTTALNGFFEKGLTGKNQQVISATTLLEAYTLALGDLAKVERVEFASIGDRFESIAVSVPQIVEGIQQIEAPLATMTQSALELQVAFQDLANDTLTNVADLLGNSLSEMLVMGKSIKTVFQDIASGLKDILKDIVATLIKAAALKALGIALGLPSGGQSFGNILGGLLGGGASFRMNTPNVQSSVVRVLQPSVKIGMNELVFALDEYNRSI